jgi:hypothetical protein
MFGVESHDLPFFWPKMDGESHDPEWIRIDEGAIRRS